MSPDKETMKWSDNELRARVEASVSKARERNDEGFKEREIAEWTVVGCREREIAEWTVVGCRERRISAREICNFRHRT